MSQARAEALEMVATLEKQLSGVRATMERSAAMLAKGIDAYEHRDDSTLIDNIYEVMEALSETALAIATESEPTASAAQPQIRPPPQPPPAPEGEK